MNVHDVLDAVRARLSAAGFGEGETGPFDVSWERDDDRHASVRMARDGGLEYLIGDGDPQWVDVSGEDGPGQAAMIADQLIAYFASAAL